MGSVSSHPHQGSFSSALDSAMKAFLGEQAAIPNQPPRYDSTGLRSKRGLEEDVEELHKILEQCSEDSFQCIIRGATFAHMKAIDMSSTQTIGVFESELKNLTGTCRQVYVDCITNA